MDADNGRGHAQHNRPVTPIPRLGDSDVKKYDLSVSSAASMRLSQVHQFGQVHPLVPSVANAILSIQGLEVRVAGELANVFDNELGEDYHIASLQVTARKFGTAVSTLLAKKQYIASLAHTSQYSRSWLLDKYLIDNRRHDGVSYGRIVCRRILYV